MEYIEKPIPGLDGYLATSNGDIISLRRGFPIVMRKTQSDHGPYRVTVQPKELDVTRGRTVASLICQTFHGPRPTRKHQAHHINGDLTDDRPTNLEWKLKGDINAKTNANYLKHARLDDLVSSLSDVVARIRNDEPLDQIASRHGLTTNLLAALRTALLGLARQRSRRTPQQKHRVRKVEEQESVRWLPVSEVIGDRDRTSSQAVALGAGADFG